MERMKSRTRILAGLGLLGCAAAAPAFAQGYYSNRYPERPVQWYVNGGAAITESDTNTNFNNGWTVGGGLNIKPAPGPFSLRLGLDYSYFDASDQLIAANPTANYGYMETLTGFADGVLELPFNPWTRFYLMAGPGFGWPGVYLTDAGVYCTPYFFGGGYGPGAGLARDTSTKFPWNPGIGIGLPLPGGASRVAEAP